MKIKKLTEDTYKENESQYNLPPDIIKQASEITNNLKTLLARSGEFSDMEDLADAIEDLASDLKMLAIDVRYLTLSEDDD